MACNSNDVINLALSQIGKKCGKTSEYAKELDSVKFYNYPKNGVANSCSIFVDDMIYRCCDPQTADYARSVVYEPNKDNCGASCTYSANYFKAHQAYIKKASDIQPGDKIFFQKSNGNLYHTGVVISNDGKTITTVEGNTDGGYVKKKTYSVSASKIAGAGRPAYTSAVSAPAPAPVIEKPASSGYTAEEIKIAKDVIRGKYGNGQTRRNNLTKAGYNYSRIQGLVNKILKGEIK